MKSKGYYLTLIAMTMKFAMDFFMPARDVAFVAFNGLLIVLVIFFRPKFFLSLRVFMWSMLAMAFFIAELCRDMENPITYKLLTLPILSILFYSVGRRMARAEMVELFKILLSGFICCFAGNYILSMALGLTATRDFWNFEHANLLGSYILVMLLPVNYILSNSRTLTFGPILKVTFVVMACLTTSTGAMVLSLAVYLRTRKVSLTRMLSPIILGCILLCAGLGALYLFNGSIFEKIVAPFVLVSNGGWTSLTHAAQNAGGITKFAEDQQGSFTWRIYAGLVYWFYVLKQGWFNTFAGNGVGGYVEVWNGAMPHNDFMLILIDFGAVFLVFIMYNVMRLISKTITFRPEWLFVVIALILRLLLENNIYSYYIMSSSVVFCSIIFGAFSRVSLQSQSGSGPEVIRSAFGSHSGTGLGAHILAKHR